MSRPPRHALITGGGTGIGLACAERLAAEGVRLTLVGRRAEPLEAAARRLPQARAVSADVTDEAAVAEAFEAARAAFGPPDLLVAAAGGAPSAPLLRTSPEAFRATLDLNLTGVFLCLRAALPDMIEAGFGRIVAVASTAGLRGYPYVAPYCAAKHGVIGLVRAAARETARTGVTINAVCPGFTDTDLVAGAVAAIAAKTGRTPEEAAKALAADNPQGRLIRPEEVAAAVAFLCSDEASAVNGAAWSVSGGEIG